MEEKLIKKFDILGILKGILISVSISLVCILVFAVILKFADMSQGLVKTINQIIKVISIFFGTYFCLKSTKQYGYLKGLIIGIGYTIIAFLVFSLLDGAFSFSKTLIFDILFGGIIGVICGIFCANIKQKIKL